MAPPKPDIIQRAQEKGLSAEYSEFESLLSARFSKDPAGVSGKREPAPSSGEARLKALGELLTEAGVL